LDLKYPPTAVGGMSQEPERQVSVESEASTNGRWWDARIEPDFSNRLQSPYGRLSVAARSPSLPHCSLKGNVALSGQPSMANGMTLSRIRPGGTVEFRQVIYVTAGEPPQAEPSGHREGTGVPTHGQNRGEGNLS
jgi:hypothetical protein